MKKPAKSTIIVGIVAVILLVLCIIIGKERSDIEKLYYTATMDKVLAQSARDNYKNDVERADEIFAQLEPSLTDEQKALIADWRSTRTRTLEEITNQTLNNIQGIGEAGEALKDSVSQQIKDLEN